MLWEKANYMPIKHNFYAKDHANAREMRRPIGLIIHWTATAQNAVAAHNWFNTPKEKRSNIKTGSSAHFVIDRDGTTIQCLDTEAGALSVDGWTVDKNRISVEVVAGPSIGDFIQPQIDKLAELLKWMHDSFDTPLKLAKNKIDSGVTYHKMYRSTDCPGDENIKKFPEIIRKAKELAGIKETEEEVTLNYNPTGTWEVKAGQWTWIYTFEEKGTVIWRNPNDRQTGKGKWELAAGSISFSWDNSKTKEVWYLPLRQSAQSGHCVIKGENYFINAIRK